MGRGIDIEGRRTSFPGLLHRGALAALARGGMYSRSAWTGRFIFEAARFPTFAFPYSLSGADSSA